MSSPTPAISSVKFGPFELDLRSGDLKRDGRHERLQGQPAQLLVVLVGRCGELVTREDLRTQLWPEDTFVDFDHGLNNAVNRIREVLGDSANSPRYIETVPRRGYRFVAEVQTATEPKPPKNLTPQPGSSVTADTLPANVRGLPARTFRVAALVALGVVVLVAAILMIRRSFRPSSTEIRSIVVLPFANLSGDSSQDYFADGMTDELTSDLATIGALSVVSRTTAMHYKGTAKPVPEIARELNADGVIEGSVLRSGDRVRITAQLIDAHTDRHLWSQSYERDLKEVLALQDEVALAIAGQVRAKLTPREHAQLAGRRPVDPVAYDAYLRGRYYWSKRTDTSLRKAADEFRLAMARDSEYAPAYAGLADVLTTRLHYQLDAPLDTIPEERAAVLKALSLDDASAEAHLALTSMYTDSWEWSKIEPEYQRALALNPRYSITHHWYADYLSTVGRHDQAIAEEKQALALDPLSPIINTWMGRRYYWARQYQQAYQATQQALELEPNFEPALMHMGMICVQLKRYNEARDALQKAVTSSKGSLIYVAFRGYAEAMAGDTLAAQKTLAQLKGGSGHRYIPSYMVAQVYVALNDKPQALKWLQRAYDERSTWMQYVEIDPAFDPIRDDRRFVDLVRRFNMPH
jgi:TolB-like protein/DNA-binding winged helix-turn-helix (wHTH) protein/Tfp pilus assembly protein PilF